MRLAWVTYNSWTSGHRNYLKPQHSCKGRLRNVPWRPPGTRGGMWITKWRTLWVLWLHWSISSLHWPCSFNESRTSDTRRKKKKSSCRPSWKGEKEWRCEPFPTHDKRWSYKECTGRNLPTDCLLKPSLYSQLREELKGIQRVPEHSVFQIRHLPCKTST